MESISEIHIEHIKSTSNLVAIVSCILNGTLYLNSIGIVSLPSGTYKLSYPTKVLNNGTRFFYFNPIRKELAEALEMAILAKYNELLSERISDVEHTI